MPQPTPYDRQNSFALFSAENPNTLHRGTDLDAEFNAVKISIGGTLKPRFAGIKKGFS